MRYIYTFLFLALILPKVKAQPNCNAFKYMGNTLKYKACKKCEETAGYYQFSKTFQQILDEAIQIDPTFDYPYRAKSVAYLKSGDLIRWKQLIDKAVTLNPLENLGYRAWYRYQFFRDYTGALADIRALEKIEKYDIGYSAGGDYHLKMMEALCHRALGNQQKALQIMEKVLAQTNYSALLYDYLHLGVLYTESEQYAKAIQAFEKQTKINPIAENQYYLGMVHKELGELDKSKLYFIKAKDLYEQRKWMFDGYTTMPDEISLQMIENELNQIQK